MVKDWMSLSWKSLVVRGVIGIVFGVVALVWPLETVIALALLWGIWALADGISSIAQAFTSEGKDGRGWLIFMGGIALLAGIYAVISPSNAAVVLTWLLGIWLIVRGLFEVFAAFSSSRVAPRWLLLVGAALSLVIGVLFVANPGAGAVTLAVWLGLLALLWGVVMVVAGIAQHRELPEAGRDKLAPGPA
jgi:uncharacterized membrane protein HdeD (DUF308 family)